MADERLGASFTIDISSLKAGLNTANKLIRESRSQFDAAAAGLDKFSDAQKIAQEKIKSLSQIIPIQEQKVDALKKQYQKTPNLFLLSHMITLGSHKGLHQYYKMVKTKNTVSMKKK